MLFDVFFSISQTPTEGYLPSEATMYRNFFHQVEAADAFGAGVAWVAESHLSSQVQKGNRRPVIPHWQGEVGLNNDIYQLAGHVFRRTRRIEVGSAIANLIATGGPLAHAERLSAFATLHGLDEAERRRLHFGFAAGRFDFMNEAYGFGPRDPLEELAWPVVKGLHFAEAALAFCRLVRGDTLASSDLPRFHLRRELFRSDAEWGAVQQLAGTQAESIPLAPRYTFEALKIVPQDYRREVLQLVVGSHDPMVQDLVNTVLPVQVFNLSITRPEVIEATHARLTRTYHPSGGAWQRSYLPRTTFVFLNESPGLSREARRRAAREEATAALSAYWTALEGTLDPRKVTSAADNALIGDAEEVEAQIRARFHPGDRLMLWFDFFNHDNARVIANMEAFFRLVAPRLQESA